MFGRRVISMLATLLAVGAFAVTSGCDWLQGTESGPRQSPVLTNLRIRPSSVICGQTFSVSFSYEDKQGDISLVRVSLKRSGSTVAREETPVWPTSSSRSSGSASFDFSFPDPCDGQGGNWEVSVQLEDELGHTSNILTGQITLNVAG